MAGPIALISNRQIDPRNGPRIDWGVALSAFALITVGLMAIYSEGVTRDGGADFRKQVLFTIIGLVPMAILFMVKPDFWLRIRPTLYCVNLVVLSAVFVFGSKKKGADRWIEIGFMQFQPSEMAKLLTVITLAGFFATHQDAIEKPTTFFRSFLHILPPLALVLLQPHLGAAMVIIVSWLAVSLIGGVPWKYLGIAVGILCALGAGVLTIPSMSAKLLHSYQQERIEGLKAKDSKGKNWQTDRAEIAFGVGGLLGSGYLKGEQKAAHFIPEQHNDFIFTVVGEEGGLFGCTIVLGLFGCLFYRIWLVMFRAQETYYKMLAAGIFAALLFHTFVNIAMLLQLVPVVGLWLPFVSYGGTALWLCMASVGLVLNVARLERPILFAER
jgi:rod shape determining protein RodA